MHAPAWLVYEDAARKVLTDLRSILGVAHVEGKQSLAGLSGTEWEVDAKAWREASDGFLIVEVRRRETARLNQESLAAVAFRIRDVEASGGIVVSPLPMQRGACLVAKSANVAHVVVSAESTTESYLAEFMGRRFLGATVVERVNATDSCDAE